MGRRYPDRYRRHTNQEEHPYEKRDQGRNLRNAAVGMRLDGTRRPDGGRRGASVKTLKRMLKKAGLKVSGKKATLTRRAKKAHLKMRGGAEPDTKDEAAVMDSMGGRRRSRRGGRRSRRRGFLSKYF